MEEKIKIYVAGSWAQREYISKEWIECLKEEGYEITHDWTKMELEEKEGRDPATQTLIAESDIEGIEDADFIVVVMQAPQDEQNCYRGTYFEMGMARALQKHIFLFNPNVTMDNYGKVLPGHGSNVFYWIDPSTITKFKTKKYLLEKLDEYREIELSNRARHKMVMKRIKSEIVTPPPPAERKTHDRYPAILFLSLVYVTFVVAVTNLLTK